MCTTDDEVCRLRNMFCKIKYIVFKINILSIFIYTFKISKLLLFSHSIIYFCVLTKFLVFHPLRDFCNIHDHIATFFSFSSLDRF